MSYNLKCGAGRADITPALGTLLYGYPRKRPAETVGDNLYATAVMLTSDNGCALMITCDNCAMNPTLASELRAIAGKAADINPEFVTISCTHTHSGPNTSIKSGWGEIDYEYIETVLKKGIKEASEKAKANLVPAVMGVAETESQVGINRREIAENGEIALGQNPWGIRDPRMTVVSFKGEDGKIIANMIHYGCHGTACGGGLQITRDWAGVMVDMLETETGAITGFWNGFEGDQGPRLPNGKTSGDYNCVKHLGARAGFDAINAFKSIKEWKDAAVRVINDTIRIPYDPIATKEEAEKKLSELGSPEQIEANKSLVNAYIHWNNVLAEHKAHDEEGKPYKTHFEFGQNITVIGNVAFCPAPFEAFAEIGLRIRAASPYAYTLNLCNTHGCYAYLPTKNDIPSGGYEVWHFLLALRTTYPLPNNTDDFWVQENLKMLKEIDN